MEVFIPTLGRRNVQETWNNLPFEVRARTRFVVDESEANQFHGLPCVILPPGCRGIGSVRQHIIDNFGPKVAMLDDDLRFARRRHDDPTRFQDATEDDVATAFLGLENCLNKYALAGISTREGGNRDTADFAWNSRILRVLCYRTDILKLEGIRFDRLPVMEDFDVALQLLEKGYQNVKLNWIVQDQRGSNLSGGCSTYRTMDTQARAARLLHSFHPDVVTVVEKNAKGGGDWATRVDVRIQWKMALRRPLKEL